MNLLSHFNLRSQVCDMSSKRYGRPLSVDAMDASTGGTHTPEDNNQSTSDYILISRRCTGVKV
jgi:hypothetical protein